MNDARARSCLFALLMALLVACGAPEPPPAPLPTGVPAAPLGPLPAAPDAQGGLILYVSPDGDDAWSGRLPQPNAERTDGPLATIAAARDALRRIRSAASPVSAGATVELRAGVYQLDAPLVLDAQDGGRPGAEITYRAGAGEQVRIMGGRLLDLARFASIADPAVLVRFAPATRTAVRQIDLRALGISDFGELRERNSGYRAVAALELVYNRQPLPLARWPNSGAWASVAGSPGEVTRGSLRYAGDRPAGWRSLADVWVHGYFSSDYSDRYERVERLDARTRTIVTSAARFDYAEYRGGQRFAFLNVLEELDQPGEWYLDRASGLLYLWPPAPLGQSEAYVTMLEQPLIQIRGASSLVVRGLTIEGGRDAGISVEDGVDITLIGLTVRNSGSDGVRITGLRCSMLSSDIMATGDAGILLRGGDQATLTPSHNQADNNHIYDYARWVRTARPAIGLEGVGMRAAHNRIHDAPAVGIVYSGNDHLIEYNDISRIALETSDVGAIYTDGSWAGRGNRIQYNYLHALDLAPPLPDSNGANGVYLDNFHSGTAVVGNVFYRAGVRAVFINSGPLNQVENNLFVGGSQYGVFIQHHDWSGFPQGILDQLDQLRYRQPPFSARYPELAGIRDVPADQLRWPRGTLVERNMFAGVPVPIALPEGVPASVLSIRNNASAAWDATAPEATLEELAPLAALPQARSIGFEPIPFAQIGLVRDQYRTSLP
jgi:hypothetical protein